MESPFEVEMRHLALLFSVSLDEEPPHLNLDVLRIRKQFSALGVVDAANIIERRPRTRQLRIGVSRISIVSL
jgi:hypothetical protein